MLMRSSDLEQKSTCLNYTFERTTMSRIQADINLYLWLEVFPFKVYAKFYIYVLMMPLGISVTF